MTTDTLLGAVAQRLRGAEGLDGVEVRDGMLWAAAAGTPSPVHYRLEPEEDALWVSWCTPDRYLSQSIEADLLWTGDDLDDLIDEELVDLGWDRGQLEPLRHHRNDEQLFTFRSRLPMPVSSLDPERDAEDLARCVLAYHLAFRELGDMTAEDDED